MTQLIYNRDTKNIYSANKIKLQPVEVIVVCPKCGSAKIDDYGQKFTPRYACGGCGQMFMAEELVEALAKELPEVPAAPTATGKPRWVINRADKFVGIARKGYMPHASVFDPGAAGDPSRDRWTPEAEKFVRLIRASEEMFDALKAIEGKLEQMQRAPKAAEAVLLQEALSECAVAISAAEHDHELMALYTYEQLEALYRDRKATLPVDHVNHREFVLTGWRYFCGYSSAGVPGWLVYMVELEEATPTTT